MWNDTLRAGERARTVVVTGATSGIGLAIARGAAAAGASVVLVGRDAVRLTAASREVGAGARAPFCVVGDLATLDGMHATADALLAHGAPIDALVHCAGLWPTRLERSADGFEEAFAVNHLAPFVLNERLRARLIESAARVVQVSAGLYVKGRVDLTRDPRGESFHKLRTYATTKLWNLLATQALARSLEGSAVRVNAVHPGVVRTKLGDMSGPLGVVLRAVKLLWLTPTVGALGPLALALDDAHAHTHGRYFDQLRPLALVPPADDLALARDVVAATRALVSR
jgi:NAD(P)-dependent dehydrogenase (short-subunit alcohol dehydrogenase family)